MKAYLCQFCISLSFLPQTEVESLTKILTFWQHLPAILPQHSGNMLQQYCGNIIFRMQIRFAAILPECVAAILLQGISWSWLQQYCCNAYCCNIAAKQFQQLCCGNIAATLQYSGTYCYNIDLKCTQNM